MGIDPANLILAVASGKGGTGKTTVATSLAKAISGTERKVWYLDCDVEAPNAHLFLNPILDQRREVNVLIPQVDLTKCTGCGRCGEICEFHAIVVLGERPLVFPELCHGCGSCSLECPEKAISEIPKVIGTLERGLTGDGIQFSQGLLNIGEPMAVPVIRQLKKWTTTQKPRTVICDSPPGTSCPVVETIRGADFVLLVTEPTPFGLHDLKLTVTLIQEMEIAAGVIINREGVGDAGVEEYCREMGLPILMRIPLERRIGEGIARGENLVEILPGYESHFLTLFQRIQGQLKQDG
jgi:MinD superfamily P-loop ATPase